MSLVAFQSGSGVAVDDFVHLVSLYLLSTAIEVGGSLLVQTDGICIGSPVAFILSKAYLNALGNLVTNFVAEGMSSEMYAATFLNSILTCSLRPSNLNAIGRMTTTS